MRHDPTFRHTGKCHVCGEDTRLLIHQECGKKMDAKTKRRKRSRKLKAYDERFIDRMTKL